MGLWRRGTRALGLWLIPLFLLVMGAGAAIVLVHWLGGEDQGRFLRSQLTKPVPVHEAARRRVQLYFGSLGGRRLEAEERRIEAIDPIAAAEAMVAGLVQGPATSELVSPIPKGTRLLHLFMTEDGTAYVDCSYELSASHPGGVTAERLTLYSIVNTLVMNLKEIERVQILIEGQVQATLAGHLDIRHPRAADPLLVVQ
jgi:hypothetical protein